MSLGPINWRTEKLKLWGWAPSSWNYSSPEPRGRFPSFRILVLQAATTTWGLWFERTERRKKIENFPHFLNIKSSLKILFPASLSCFLSQSSTGYLLALFLSQHPVPSNSVLSWGLEHNGGKSNGKFTASLEVVWILVLPNLSATIYFLESSISCWRQSLQVL